MNVNDNQINAIVDRVVEQLTRGKSPGDEPPPKKPCMTRKASPHLVLLKKIPMSPLRPLSSLPRLTVQNLPTSKLKKILLFGQTLNLNYIPQWMMG